MHVNDDASVAQSVLRYEAYQTLEELAAGHRALCRMEDGIELQSRQAMWGIWANSAEALMTPVEVAEYVRRMKAHPNCGMMYAHESRAIALDILGAQEATTPKSLGQRVKGWFR